MVSDEEVVGGMRAAFPSWKGGVEVPTSLDVTMNSPKGITISYDSSTSASFWVSVWELCC